MSENDPPPDPIAAFEADRTVIKPAPAAPHARLARRR